MVTLCDDVSKSEDAAGAAGKGAARSLPATVGKAQQANLAGAAATAVVLLPQTFSTEVWGNEWHMSVYGGTNGSTSVPMGVFCHLDGKLI